MNGWLGRVARAALASVLIAAPVVIGTATAVDAAPATLTIGVDHATPAGHNFQYTDFFPRANVTVHQGDVVDFAWANTPDGFHTATVLKSGETPDAAWSSVYPQVSVDTDESGQLQFGANFGPTSPPAGSGAPGACGDQATPCAYDGTKDVNSGPSGTDGKAKFFVTMNAPVGTTVNYVCVIHPGMSGSLTVVDPATTASTQSDLDTAAAAQAAADTNGALAAESAVGPAKVTNNPDGKTHTVTLTAGVESDHVQVVEFLPRDASVAAGDTITWTTAAHEPHTVTFPKGTEEGDPIPQVCEATPTDTPVPNTPGPPCGDPTKLEVHFNPRPAGATAIVSATTFGTSGVIGVLPATPTNYSFTFPTSGTFNYFCHIHENGMVGSVTVAAAAVRANPTFTG